MMVQRRFGGQRGQSLVEFALVLPVLSVILFGLTDLGLAIHNAVTITNAARDGARVAAVNSGSASAVATAVADDEKSTSLVDCTTSTPTISKTAYASPPPTYSSYTVTASCSYSPITPLGPLFKLVGATANSTFTISSSTTMKDSACTPEVGCH
jgi:Flp pilus assembly protein TadG